MLSRLMRLLTLYSLILLAGTSHAISTQNSTGDGFRTLTQLQILAKGPAGERLQLQRADIYLDFWGGGKLVALPRYGAAATLRLDRAWLCFAAPDICTRLMNEPSRVILQVDGYAPVTLRVFWPGQERPPLNARVQGADIELTTGRVHLDEGNATQLEVTFRRPVARTLQVVDDFGKGVAGIQFDAMLFFSNSSHTAMIEGESLFMGETGVDGRSAIPDVDGEIAIQFYPLHFELLPPGEADTRQFIFWPVAPLTTIRIREFEKRPLRLTVINPHGSAAGLQLEVCLRNNHTNGGCVYLGETDAQGNFTREDFYPEEEELNSISDKSVVTLWQANIGESIQSSANRTITLP